MENFGSIVKNIYLAPKMATRRNLKNSLSFKRQLIFCEWQKIVGENIAAHTVPYFRGEILLISTTPAWADELKFFRRDLIDKINGYVAAELVKDIRIVARENEKDIGMRSEEFNQCGERRDESGVEEKELENAALHEIADSINSVADNRLKRKIVDAYRSIKRSEAAKLKRNFHRCKGKGCRSLIEREREFCAVCEIERHNAHLKRLEDFLIACPWANYAAANDYETCRAEEFNRVRQYLLRKQAETVEYRGDATAVGPYTAEEYVLAMLYHSLPLEKLNDAVMSKTLYELRGSLKAASKHNIKNKKQG